MQAQVEPGLGATGAEQIAVLGEQLIGLQAHLGEALAEGSGQRPVGGGAAAVEQAGGAATNGTQRILDIKPENLLLDEDGELRLLDFGLAYCPGLSQDEANSLPGTPSYIAPEAFDGAQPSAQQDIYGAGVTLYRLLTGHYPFGEIEAFQHPRFGTPTPASRYRPDLPAWLDECLGRALASDPGQRFETAEEWLLALEQGERKTLTSKPRPLLEREPLKVWRGIALLSLLANLALLVLCLGCAAYAKKQYCALQEPEQQTLSDKEER